MFVVVFEFLCVFLSICGCFLGFLIVCGCSYTCFFWVFIYDLVLGYPKGKSWPAKALLEFNFIHYELLF